MIDRRTERGGVIDADVHDELEKAGRRSRTDAGFGHRLHLPPKRGHPLEPILEIGGPSQLEKADIRLNDRNLVDS